jgi:MFS transporter, ACS family, tartrate transporter
LLEELDREEREKTAARRVRIWDALRQPQTLLLILVYFLVVTSNQGLIFFFPSITESMPGLSVSLRTFFTTLPYVFGMAGILLVGFSAHRTGEQRLHTAIPMLSSAAALTLAVLSGSHMAFTLTFFCLAGATTQAYLPAFWTLPTAFLGKDGAAVAIGLINSLGNLGGFAGPYLFGYLKTATGNFRSGLWVLACSTACAGLLALTIRIPRRKSLHTKQSDDNQT